MKLENKLLQEMQSRQHIKDCSNLDILDQFSQDGKVAVYAGFDPTADSLHVGHLVALKTLKRFADQGFTTIAIVGTGTALVGDPTGRNTARPLLDDTMVSHNADKIEASIRAILGEGDHIHILRNGDWLNDLMFVKFLRDIGRLVSVGKLLSLSSVETRLEEGGMSFLEICYPLMQAYDFLTLVRRFGPVLQIGGSDQWGNICAGLDVISRFNDVNQDSNKSSHQAFGMTLPLLTRHDGTKMGKTAGNAVWLDADKTSDFEFFQFWRTLADVDVPIVDNMFSDHAKSWTDLSGAELEANKEALALEMTSLVRGAENAQKAMMASRGKGRDATGLVPIVVESEDELDLPTLMVKLGLCPSKGAVTRLMVQGGLKVNGEKRLSLVLNKDDFKNQECILSAGKTQHGLLKLGEHFTSLSRVSKF